MHVSMAISISMWTIPMDVRLVDAIPLDRTINFVIRYQASVSARYENHTKFSFLDDFQNSIIVTKERTRGWQVQVTICSPISQSVYPQ